MTINSDRHNPLTDSYEDYLHEELQNPKSAENYLNAALADPDPRVFELALQDVLKARLAMPVALLANRLRLPTPQILAKLSKN